MLGIIFTGGDGPAPEIIRRELDGKTHFCIAADSGLVAAERAGIKPDCIIGDMDSVAASRLAAYPPECIMRHDTDKDYTDTELALTAAIERGCEIWIIGGGGGRLDHLFGIRSLFERDVFPRRWITDTADIRCVDAASGDRLSLALEKGALVSVFPLGAGPWKAKSSGLKWRLDDLKWNRGFFGLSNVVVDGYFSIAAEQGRFMVILPLHARSK
ncbi:MAG: thiamine diphosphokinase [Treponema sp.]|nr:thiamine diphosphokinase [Treponema sp.]